jgi:predicted nucleic acid-binding protein
LTDYADTSFLVSLYVTDRHSVEARHRIESASRLWFTPLHRAEWCHAIGQHVFREKMNASQVEDVDLQLKRDQEDGLWVLAELPERAFDLCAELGRRYAPKFAIRSLDTLHVACALELKAERFWTFDERQAKLAKAMGITHSS